MIPFDHMSRHQKQEIVVVNQKARMCMAIYMGSPGSNKINEKDDK